MFKRLTLFLFVALITISAQAQNFGIDFENIRVDDLSDQQISQLYQRMQDRGLTVSEVETLALARGMNPSEVSKLRSRINSVRSSMSGAGTGEASNQERTRIENTSQLKPDTMDVLLDPTEKDNSKVFGSDIFSSQSITFEPSLNIPTPKNYSLGPGDELFIDIWGASETTYQLVISPEGSINVSNVGPITVSGLTIEEAKERLLNRLSTIYSGLKGPDKTTYMQVTLGDIRSIKVSIVGEVSAPGTYTLSSLSSVFNALYAAGGPNNEGSYRSIKVLRDGSVYQRVDLYEFLSSGDLSDNIILKDQDIIKVEPYVNRITLKGETKNVGLFETLEGETFNDLLEYAGGFNQFAYKKRVKLERKTDTEKRIVDIVYPENGNTVLRSGDIITVGRILDRYENKVEIKGPVFRPGEYQLEENPTLSRLIENAEGLMGDAFMERAVIFRTQEDYSIEAIPVNLNQLLSDTASSDIELVKDDVVRISSIFDLRERRTVRISGSVLNPDTYEYVENSSLKDLIYQANGFKEEATPYNIEIARRVTDTETGQINNQIAEIITVNIDNGLAYEEELEEIELMPYDQVFVRKSPAFEVQKTVRITGEVLYPGEYAISTRDFKISDLVEKAGGITEYAYPEGASLTRNFNNLNGAVNENDSLPGNAGETISQVGIQLQEIIRNPNSDIDLLLNQGDVLEVPKLMQTVNVQGEVLFPINVRYDSGKNFRQYINSAGGFSERANRKKAYIVYANGEVDRTKRFLFFKSYPDVRPGSMIYIPQKEERERISAQERIAILSTIVSMAAIVTNTIFQIRRN